MEFDYADCLSLWERQLLCVIVLPDKGAVFIDGGYFSKVRLTLGFASVHLDYASLSDKLCAGCDRFRTYYYDCMPYKDQTPSPDDEKRYKDKQVFIESLRNLDKFEIRLGHLLKTDGGDFKQKGVDILLSIDLTRLSWSKRIYKAILLTADTDFIPAIQEAKNAGVTVTLAFCQTMSRQISRALYQVCDERVRITADLLRDCTKQTVA